MKALRQLLLRLLKVPPEPRPPPGASDSLRVFRAAPAYYRYGLMKWGFTQIGAVLGLFLTFGFFSLHLGALDRFDFLSRFEVIAIAFVILQAVVTLALLRLRYELRWYLVSDRALRIREGIYSIREQTMTVANIQNMAIKQGPIQRFFGISDLEVRTAGGGKTEQGDAKANDPHLGSLTGIDNAQEVRDLILASLSRHRDAGLGDPDEASPKASSLAAAPVLPKPASSDAVDAATELLEQVRGLRSQLASLEM